MTDTVIMLATWGALLAYAALIVYLVAAWMSRHNPANDKEWFECPRCGRWICGKVHDCEPGL